MKRIHGMSVFLICLSAVIGLIRGYRMAMHPKGNSILFPYPQDMMKLHVFSNYAMLGWVIFFFVGIFSLLVLACIFLKKWYAPYLIIVEGIFVTFLTLTHILLSGISLIHVIFFPLSIATIMVGVLQTPKEF